VIIAVIVVAALVVGTPCLALEHRRLRHIEDCWYVPMRVAASERRCRGGPVRVPGSGPLPLQPLLIPFGAPRRLRVAADFLGDFDDSADGADEAEV
jgi:hypothetical protein